MDDAIRWLIDNDDKKKLQAVMVLRELCKAAPIIAFNKLIEKYYKNILYAAGDNKAPIREAAADCLAVFLSLLAHRESQLRQAVGDLPAAGIGIARAGHGRLHKTGQTTNKYLADRRPRVKRD